MGMTPDQYQQEAIKTLSIGFYPERVDLIRLVELVNTLENDGEALDRYKRLLYYGNPKRSSDEPIPFPLRKEDLPDQGRRDVLHAAIGAVTESIEMLTEVVAAILERRDFDATNLKEEAGDIEFYLAVLRKAMGWTQGEVQAGNIRKLQVRYGGAFNADGAAHRDTDAERAAVEGA